MATLIKWLKGEPIHVALRNGKGILPKGTNAFVVQISTVAHLIGCQDMQNVAMRTIWELLVDIKED